MGLPNRTIPAESVFARLGGTALGFAMVMPSLAASASEGITTIDISSAIVPEPDTLALLGGALAVFALWTLIRRKRRRK